MDSNYQVPDCGCAERWYFHSVRLLGARGIGAAKEAAQKYGRENAPLLLPGTHTTSYTIKKEGIVMIIRKILIKNMYC